MLNENDVIAVVKTFLNAAGWTITRTSSTTQTGPDLEAVHPASARRLYVEAKGATSARPTSSRYGQPFSASQVRDHVANALYAAAKVREDDLSAIAVPRNRAHAKCVHAIRHALTALKIAVFWVDGDNVVDAWNWDTDDSAGSTRLTSTGSRG